MSLQANRSKKDRFCDALCSVLGEPEYLLSGEVSVSVEWMIHERLRYETLVTPDVDNTLKVVLDAISGPMGVLINDCQVHHVGCHWIDWTRPDEQVTVTIKHISDDWVRKKDLVFVKFDKHLCWPLNLDLPTALLQNVLTMVEQTIDANRELMALTDACYLAQRVMPIQRFFHSGRLEGFKIMTVEQIREHVRLT